MNLYSIGGHVYTAGTGATTDVQLYNLTTGNDVLSTKLTIDATELDSSTAATAAVIDGDYNSVSTATVLRIDVDQIASGSAAKGLEIRMEFRGSTS